MLPSFSPPWGNTHQCKKPRILLLEVRPRENPDAAPFARILVEREATYKSEADETISEASIRLSYQLISSEYRGVNLDAGSFSGGYSKVFNRVSLTAASVSDGGGVFLDPEDLRGQRIGTYLMSEVVQWVQRWPDAEVNSVELVPWQANEQMNKVRRNQMYEQIGLRFDYIDGDERNRGYSRPMRTGDLTVVNTWKKNIRELNILEHLCDTQRRLEFVSNELRIQKMAARRFSQDYLKMEATPLRWALGVLLRKTTRG